MMDILIEDLQCKEASSKQMHLFHTCNPADKRHDLVIDHSQLQPKESGTLGQLHCELQMTTNISRDYIRHSLIQSNEFG